MIDNAANRLKVKRGVELPQSKLTDDDVRLIRQLHDFKKKEIRRLNDALSIEAIANKFGVHRRTIEKVLFFDGWRHVI